MNEETVESLKSGVEGVRGEAARGGVGRARWTAAICALGLLACPESRPAARAVDAGPLAPAKARCPADDWAPARRCELVRAIFHLEGPNGHEVEWYATDCAKWPVRLDVAVACAGAWAPWFGEGVAPECGDEKLAAVNSRTDPRKARGLALRLTPADAGFAFRFAPAQLGGGEPRELDAFCGTLEGTIAPELDGGWRARATAAP